MPTQNDYKDAVKVARQFGSLASVLEQLGDLDSASDVIPGFMPVEQINVTATTMGHAFTCKAA